jgi:hypothetical protein
VKQLTAVVIAALALAAGAPATTASPAANGRFVSCSHLRGSEYRQLKKSWFSLLRPHLR